MMEVGEKAEAKQDTLNIILKGSGESDFLRFTPAIERKLSKRREAQEERNVVLDLFKELVGKFNEGNPNNTQATPKSPPRTSPAGPASKRAGRNRAGRHPPASPRTSRAGTARRKCVHSASARRRSGRTTRSS